MRNVEQEESELLVKTSELCRVWVDHHLVLLELIEFCLDPNLVTRR
jgi:hypothetical protein